MKAAIAEAVLNLALSILMVKTVGLYGVAWGTSIAMTVVHVWFWPRYVRKILNVPIGTYLLERLGEDYALLDSIRDCECNCRQVLESY